MRIMLMNIGEITLKHIPRTQVLKCKTRGHLYERKKFEHMRYKICVNFFFILFFIDETYVGFNCRSFDEHK